MDGKHPTGSPVAASRDRSSPAPAHRKLGQILLEQGKLQESQLQEALAIQQRKAGGHNGQGPQTPCVAFGVPQSAQLASAQRLGELLCQLGHVDSLAVREALVAQAGIPWADLEKHEFSPEVLSAIPAELAFRHKVLPLAVYDRTLSLAMADPFDRLAVETVRVLCGRRVERYYCPQRELAEATRRLYGSSVARMIADLNAGSGGIPKRDVSRLGSGSSDTADIELTSQLQELAREPSVVNLVNLVILEAVDAHASDIHVEPFEKELRIKYRLDGLLHDAAPPPKSLQPAIVSRIKIMAGMNIAERFVPQDGHISFQSPRGKIDIRAATVPTVFGECVALRILDRSASLIELGRLGLREECLEHFGRLLERPHGIVLVTGPTGSGKTTTLYAALSRIYTPEKKIITIEDPVEYQLEGINQIPVNPKRGLDFANGLRAILRQDPDIIMVGEIRDRETADIAIRSALTGHLVFSTLHTNDAPGAVTRLLDMGIEPFLLASSLEGVLAQRLVRTICPHCRTPYQPPAELLERIGPKVGGTGGGFCQGQRCRQCRQTGYIGRVGIFELLRITAPVRSAILRRLSAAEIAAAAPEDHEPMRADGIRKAWQGLTTLEEVLRVTQDAQEQ
jgi:type II secretory ATPase GspE/PulE/Tfp pilus assembly ATPase PilB-like protein